ncbi:type II toxin-antitoxin system RelE/ParE family toxin [Plastoroseomonas arctica]|uniref:Type II toxin-antitoxin system RelE/ParE family toxin n=1 Tax=Plastoroseomonas arctica TaxID=1509237 RepID=A0AAF1KHM9_9PROT|nr:type II toxin-antitoxin system RelE/ParE family toxin [Plastoroseomonas arctica]MBR0653610.1 type II toxin-antitoxin system RelE/ParE family toxin [Plastoroseomonas arctica]
MRLGGSGVARAQLRAARDHVAGDNPDAADALVSRSEAAAGRLMDFPEIGRPLGTDLRVFAIPRSPFRLVYRMAPEDGMILILAVWHGARQWPFGPA